MSDLYNCPELKTSYCKSECPIGKTMPLATQITGIEGIALRLVKQLDFDEIMQMKKSLIDIAVDGVISDDEKPELQAIMTRLNELSEVISEIRLISEKVLKE